MISLLLPLTPLSYAVAFGEGETSLPVAAITI